MEQVSRRALFSLGLGALALPVVKLLPDKVLPTAPKPKIDKMQQLQKLGWEELPAKTQVKLLPDKVLYVKTYKVTLAHVGDMKSIDFDPPIPHVDQKHLHEMTTPLDYK